MQVGERARYQCYEGYKLVGKTNDKTNLKRKCQENDTHVYWNKPIPSCERKFMYTPKHKEALIDT